MQESPVERIKKESKGLRGTLKKSVANNITGALADDDAQLVKFHGIYQQDDRDTREARTEKKLERAWSFMIRLRLPGGDMTADQWLKFHKAAGNYSTGVIKITTRQTLQLHGIIKANLKPTIQSFNSASLDSIATCGDINRNVAAPSHPNNCAVFEEVHAYAAKISAMLMPKSKAWYEIWLDEEKVAEYSEEDLLYENRYLPRKFKIGIAIPPNNDTDVLTNDIGLIAIIENEKLLGFNIAIGGGLSQTHGNAETYPRLATIIGFAENEEQVMRTVYEVLTVQRDYGNRSDRKLARLKYTVDKYGIDWFREQVEARTRMPLLPAKPFAFDKRGDVFGWTEVAGKEWIYGLRVENGRVTNENGVQLLDALNEIAREQLASFRFTSNQNLMLVGISAQNKDGVEQVLQKHGVLAQQDVMSGIRKNTMACVALPTCPLALAEAQRYLPTLTTLLEPVFEKHGLLQSDFILRMTGCPNGCGRSVAAEIGLIGTAPGLYNLHIGGDREGLRLNTLYKNSIGEKEIIETIDELLASYKQHGKDYTTAGDFFFNHFITNKA